MFTVEFEFVFFFFFSSRRRHTRFDCDWSSDVCSSDLASAIFGCRQNALFFAIADLGVPIPGDGMADAAEAVRARRRSGEGRVGEEGRSRWWPDHLKKKKEEKYG